MRALTIKMLLELGAFPLSLFDERGLAEVTSPDNPMSGVWCAAFHGSLPSVPANGSLCSPPTETELAKVAKAVTRKRKSLRGTDQIGVAVCAVFNGYKVA
ncbi:MAG: IS1634 family transposase, partial [Acetobacteraceae bacterium]|nr:IS1634 family transposase [Acetobacteraceae bacterium]